MNIIFALSHPAHYHLFKNISRILKVNGNEVLFVMTPKDILEKLLIANDEHYLILAPRKKHECLFSKFQKIVNSTRSLCRIAKQNNANLLIGCMSQIAYTGRILGIPSIFVGEDDFSYTWIQGILTYPFVNCIVAPAPTNTGPFNHKRISYQGYQKLAYLHPGRFLITRNIEVHSKKRILIRLVDLSAYHDISANGLSDTLLNQFIKKYRGNCKISISSERELPAFFEQFRISIEPNNMHNELLNTDLFLSDSQSMTVEASLLGIPNIRINNFSDKISILNELEKKYRLTFSLSPKDSSKLIGLSELLLSDENILLTYKQRRDLMLADKIDVTAFFVWFIENYPNSYHIMKINPDYQNKFR
jgi:predicted glycosyltransferase